MVIAPSVTPTVKAEQFHIKVAKFTLIGLANEPSHRTFDMFFCLRDITFVRLSASASIYNGRMNSVTEWMN